MAQSKISPTERIASSFKKLAASSNNLKLATVDLGKSISALDEALNSLNLGVSAWHKIAGHEDDDGSFWSRDIGYTQVGTSWGIALRRASGHHHGDIYDEEVWPFTDAPPWMSVEATVKLPDLFDELNRRAEETIKRMNARSTEAQELARAVNAAKEELECGW
jgi:hypothetical protein